MRDPAGRMRLFAPYGLGEAKGGGEGAVGAREIRPSGWSVAYSELSQRLAASVFRLNKRVTVEKSRYHSLTRSGIGQFSMSEIDSMTMSAPRPE
jgi:hypothetical protein